jgi:hypothetical protein
MFQSASRLECLDFLVQGISDEKFRIKNVSNCQTCFSKVVAQQKLKNKESRF